MHGIPDALRAAADILEVCATVVELADEELLLRQGQPEVARPHPEEFVGGTWKRLHCFLCESHRKKTQSAVLAHSVWQSDAVSVTVCIAPVFHTVNDTPCTMAQVPSGHISPEYKECPVSSPDPTVS